MRTAAARLARNVAWLGTGELALKGALFAAGVLVARGFGPPGMGVFTVSYGAALVALQLLAGGQVEVLIRETARRPGDGRALHAHALWLQRRIAAAVVPLAVAGALLVPAPELRRALLAFLPYACLRCRLITAGAVFKGLDRMDVEVRARALELGVTLPCLAVAALAALPVWATGLAFSAGGAAGLAWIAWQLRLLPPGERAETSRSVLRREAVPFLGLSVVHQLAVRVDSFLLAGLGVLQSEIGRYGAGGAPVQGVSGAAQVLAVAGYPSLARAAAGGTLRPRLALAVAAGGAALGCGLAVVLFAARDPLVRIVFGPAFAGSAALLGVLAWCLPGACVSMLTGTVLAATRRQHWPLASQSALVLLSVGANLWAIPRWGVRGCAAVAVMAATLAAVAGTVLAVVAAAQGSPPAQREAAPLAAVAERVD